MLNLDDTRHIPNIILRLGKLNQHCHQPDEKTANIILISTDKLTCKYYEAIY